MIKSQSSFARHVPHCGTCCLIVHLQTSEIAMKNQLDKVQAFLRFFVQWLQVKGQL
jgi:hypothetical protein